MIGKSPLCVEEGDPRRRGRVAGTGSTVPMTDEADDMRRYMEPGRQVKLEAATHLPSGNNGGKG